jgi:phosphate transport system permease protein
MAGPVTAVSYGDSGAGRVIVAKRGRRRGFHCLVAAPRHETRPDRQGETQSAGGSGHHRGTRLRSADRARASQNGAMVAGGLAKSGGIHYFLADSGGTSKRQTFAPFGAEPPRQMDFLFGGVSIIVTGPDGRQEQWSLFRKEARASACSAKPRSFPRLAKAR